METPYGFSMWSGLEISRGREFWHCLLPVYTLSEYCLTFRNEALRSCLIQIFSSKNSLVERESYHRSCKCTVGRWVFCSVLVEKVDLGCPGYPKQSHGVQMNCWYRDLAGSSMHCSPLLCTFFCFAVSSFQPSLFCPLCEGWMCLFICGFSAWAFSWVLWIRMWKTKAVPPLWVYLVCCRFCF